MQEFIDFLGTQPPFDGLGADDLQRLAVRISVEYFARGAVIVDEGEAPLDHMWVVRTGELEVLDRGRIIDVLTTGDSFGHISVLTGLRPALTVRARTDSLCYRMPDPRTLVERPADLQFTHFGTMISRERLTRPGVLSVGQNLVERHMRPVLWAGPGDSIGQAAQRITSAGTSSILIHTPDGIGIATDRDFRAEVASGQLSPSAGIDRLAKSPVATIGHKRTVADALIRMVEAGVHHLVVTDDGQQAVGVVRAIDLGSVDVRDPLVIRSAIEAATSVDDLSHAGQLITPTVIELYDTGVPALHIGTLLATIVESLLQRLLQLHQDPADTATLLPGPPDFADSPASPVQTSWLVLGSLARREPLPASDVDTAVMWSTPSGSHDPADALRHQATRVLDELERCGRQRCPDGANADNPLFSRSRTAWVASARRWVDDPNREGALLLSSIVADSRPITNLPLGRAITDTLRATTRGLPFLDLLLRYTLHSRPPVGFVRDFVVEHSGEHRGGFDLKSGGLTPISALARWLGIVTGNVQGGTLERLNRAAEVGLLTGGEREELTRAFEDIYSLTFEREISALRASQPVSTWVNPRQMDGLARRHLRESFRAVSTVQTTVSNQWQSRYAARTL